LRKGDAIIPSLFIIVLEIGSRRSNVEIRGTVFDKWIFRRWDVGIWTGLGWLRIGRGGGGL